MTEEHMGTVRRKRNLYAALAGFMAAVMLIGAFLWGTAATQRGEVLASNTITLAEQVKQACATGQLVIDDQNLCEKADQIAAAPAELVPGPPGLKGDKGDRGEPGQPGNQGVPGMPGGDGRDSTVPGPGGPPGSAGLNGINGTDGVDSTVPGPPGPAGANGAPGAPGQDGADSTVPGPAGPQGPAGTDGQTPTSFTFTDRTGTTYTCTPNPPGSSTYTCAASGGGLL